MAKYFELNYFKWEKILLRIRLKLPCRGKAAYSILDLFIDSTWTIEKLEVFDNMRFRENSKVLIKMLVSWTVFWKILLCLVDSA